MSKRAFTLIELMIVMAVIAVISGMIVVQLQGIGRASDEKLVVAELATIREAALRFKHDMGQPPQFIAELLQSPDPSNIDGMGGWWWRSNGNHPVPNAQLPALPNASLYEYDPAIDRGWNGPYLQRELLSDIENKLREVRENPASASNSQGTIESDNTASPPKKMAILKSDYNSFPQVVTTSDERIVSHYQFVFDDSSGEIVVRFLNDPAVTNPRVVAKINLGITP